MKRKLILLRYPKLLLSIRDQKLVLFHYKKTQLHYAIIDKTGKVVKSSFKPATGHTLNKIFRIKQFSNFEVII
jgi:hypothetical protein